ncbi:MAG: type II toxin-antitoxin system VapC family toxin [Gallionella sp.]
MSNKLVLDSCVFNKLFLQEPDREQALALFSAIAQHNYRVIVPSLFLYEVLAIARVSGFSTTEAYALIVAFQQSQLQLVELDRQCIEKTMEICDSGHANSGFPSFYDACYHALAIQHNCYFVTADKRHFGKAAQFGHIVLLSNWESIL